eukprot:TRINITY_DN68072_c0_g1_i1.p1 TRINITY_DN68072_c0_g1~~TRINITY_DN68072_c0_g1_i1.p1  ORF type:complete len:243 (+),score=28.91 TRINITY_DN68072_c0_g1_i1:98-826(+)
MGCLRLRPALQCCCGCSLEFGTQAMLLVNLSRCIIFVLIGLDAVMHPDNGLAIQVAGSMGNKCALTASGVTGVTLTLLGLWGVHAKWEQAVRASFYYLVLACAIDVSIGVYENLLHHSCLDIQNMVSYRSRPMMCGAERLMWFFALLALTLAEVYQLYIVFSYCEEEAFSTQINAFSMLSSAAEEKRLVGNSLHLSMSDPVTLASHAKFQTFMAPVGNHTIYGTYHDVQYPPESPHPRSRQF